MLYKNCSHLLNTLNDITGSSEFIVKEPPAVLKNLRPGIFNFFISVYPENFDKTFLNFIAY